MKKRIVQAVLNEPEVVGVVTRPPVGVWDRLLQWAGIRKQREVELRISGATLGTMYRISGLFASLKTNSDKGGGHEKVWDLMVSNIGILAEFCAISIHNKPGEPPSWIKRALIEQFTANQILDIARVVYRRLGIGPFFGIMGLVRDLDLLKDTQETVAPGQPSEEPSNTGDLIGTK